MPPRSGHPWRGLAAAAVFVVAACSDSTGPQAHLASPEQLSADLQSVAGVVTSPAFASFATIGTAAGSPAAVSTPAGALLQAAPITPPRTSSQPYADAPRRLAALYPQDVITASVIDGELAPPAVTSGGSVPHGIDNLGGAVEAYLSSHFSGFPNGVPPPGLYHRILKEIEVPLLTAALAATRGNQIRAADLLGLNRNTLRKKIRDLDIQVYRTGS